MSLIDYLIINDLLTCAKPGMNFEQTLEKIDLQKNFIIGFVNCPMPVNSISIISEVSYPCEGMTYTVHYTLCIVLHHHSILFAILKQTWKSNFSVKIEFMGHTFEILSQSGHVLIFTIVGWVGSRPTFRQIGLGRVQVK